MNFLRKHTPRWIVFFIDIFICLCSITLAYLLRFNFSIPENYLNSLYYVIPCVLFIRSISFVIGRTYAGIVRYTSTKDAERIFIVISTGSCFFMICNIISNYFLNYQFIIPFSIVIIDFLITTFVMTGSRLVVKTLYLEFYNPTKHKTNVIIYGTDDFGIITKRTLDRDAGTKHKVIAFIDNTNRDAGKKLEGATIYNSDNLDAILNKHSVSNLIISKKYISPNRKREIIETCLHHNVKVLTVPAVENWINGELSFNQIKSIKIEDLLGRSPITLDKNQIRQQILNKTVLVTGAAGSIGSEIVRQITKFNPKKIILFDQAESPLYDLELELNEQYNFYNFEIIIGDITNYEKINNVFETFKPSLVYHAAAYKHVPLMENNPDEAIRTNVFGTKIIADLAVKNNVTKFVMISTDKAVNPTNVMGASKRIAEIYIQSLNNTVNANFITTRFGNVLGSNGSVIPRFRKQIEKGGPITVTHPEVTRYFMTISESCQLVLEASSIGKGGEIFIFDMGKSIKIVDLAKNMIKLSGLAIGKDIHLNYTGLRPGEKLYEELLNIKENSLPTHHSQIMIAKVREYDIKAVSDKINEFIELLKVNDNYGIVKLMKEIVPEFKSKNSVYEELDMEN